MSADRPIDQLTRIFASAPDPMTLTVEQLRKGTEALCRSNPPSKDLKIEKAEVAGVSGRWIEAPGSMRGRTILFIHGGAFAAGSSRSHCSMAGELGRSARARVFAADYRLAPEYPFPAGLHDCHAVYRSLASGSQTAFFAVAGDSAGGCLALSTVMHARNQGWRAADAIALFSPWLDLECASDSHIALREKDPLLNAEFLRKMAAQYLGETDSGAPAVSPLLDSFSGLPPILVQVGENEVLRGDANTLAERAKRSSTSTEVQVWPEMFHVWHGYTSMLPQAKQALAQAGAFLAAHWSGKTQDTRVCDD